MISIAYLFFFFCCALALDLIRRTNEVPLAVWPLMGMGLIYGLAWPEISEAAISRTVHDNLNVMQLIANSANLHEQHTIYAFIAAVFLYFGYLTWSYPGRRDIGSHTGYGLPKNFTFAAFVLLFASIAFQYLYTKAYGGILEQLEYSRFIRSGHFVIENRFSFLKPFGMISVFSAILFFVAVLSSKNRFLPLIGFAIAFPFACLVLYSAQGRISMVLFLATFALSFFMVRVRNPYAIFFGAIIGFMISIPSIYGISVVLDLKAAPSMGAFIAKEVGFPFASFFGNLNSSEEWRWFIDFAMVPMFFIPSSMHPDFVSDVSAINTAIVAGAAKGQSGVTGSVPMDILAFGLIQFGTLGVAICAYIFGVLLKIAHRFLLKIGNRTLYLTLLAYVSLRFGFLATFYFYPSHIVEGGFPFFVSLFVLVALARMPKFAFRILRPTRASI